MARHRADDLGDGDKTASSSPTTGLIAALRANAWPDRPRSRVFAVFVLLAYLPMLARVFGEATGRVGSDFLAFWGAGRLVLRGTPWRAYDLVAEHAAQMASHTGQMVAYVNPPPYLFLTAPLGFLSYPSAWLAWAAAGWVVWFLVCRQLLPKDPLVVLAFPGAYLAASHAQNGFVTGALLVGGVLALARSEMLAGALFGALVIKPHLALLVPLWLLAGRRWRALGAGAASALMLCGLSLAVFGPGTWAAWPDSFRVSEVLMAQTGGEFFLRMATPYAALRVLAGPGLVPMVGQAAITLACAGLLWRVTRRRGADAGTGALMLATTAIASPYLFSYDFPFLIQPVAWVLTDARMRGWRPFEKIALVLLWFAPLATRAAALPLHLNLMPVAGAALVAVVASRLGGPSDQSTING
ncbi:glycosyltransferase family 87 protein [Novosphingobium nitrogenifigens]|nr:glycosyltransferase family 87 protein [Novosphingobium nitrogenifigens]